MLESSCHVRKVGGKPSAGTIVVTCSSTSDAYVPTIHPEVSDFLNLGYLT